MLIDTILLLVHGYNLWHFHGNFKPELLPLEWTTDWWNSRNWRLAHTLMYMLTMKNGVCSMFCWQIEIREFCGFETTQEGMRLRMGFSTQFLIFEQVCHRVTASFAVFA